MPDILSFFASHIISGDGLQVIQDAAINVKDGIILSVGNPLPEAKTFHLGKVLLSPMFIDAHTHLGDTGAKELGVGLPLDQVVVPPHGLKHRFLASQDTETHIQQMRHGLLEMLNNGIIACADFREQGLSGIQALQQAAQNIPIHVISLGRMAERNDSEDQILQEAREILRWANGLGIRDISAYPLEVMKALRSEYPDKLFAMHVSENRDVEINSRVSFGAGQAARSLEIHPDLLIHLTHTPLDELSLLSSARVAAVCCPRANGILGDGLPDVSSWINAGVSFGIGSDNMMISSPDMFREMDYLSRMLRGYHQNPACIDFSLIFKAATINGAKALKLDQSLGSLAPGKEASFMVLDLESLNFKYAHDLLSAMVHRACISDIRNIFIKGEKYK